MKNMIFFYNYDDKTLKILNINKVTLRMVGYLDRDVATL